MGQSQGVVHRAVIWKKGKPKLLGKLRGLPYSGGADLNDRGIVVGSASDGAVDLFPVRWAGGRGW